MRLQACILSLLVRLFYFGHRLFSCVVVSGSFHPLSGPYSLLLCFSCVLCGFYLSSLLLDGGCFCHSSMVFQSKITFFCHHFVPAFIWSWYFPLLVLVLGLACSRAWASSGLGLVSCVFLALWSGRVGCIQFHVSKQKVVLVSSAFAGFPFFGHFRRFNCRLCSRRHSWLYRLWSPAFIFTLRCFIGF